MLRILLLLLAVISAALAIILDMTWLFGVAAALALALLGVWVMQVQKRRAPASSKPQTQAPMSREQELASLGITEVRARGAGQKRDREMSEEETVPSLEEHSSAAAAGVPSTDGIDSTADRDHGDGVRPAAVQRMGTRRKTHGAHLGEDRFSMILGPYLQSLRAAIDAQTVSLLKQEDVEPQYQIEAIVSLNSYARSGGSFSTRRPLLAGTSQHDVTVVDVNEDDLAQSDLGYYREPIKVRQVAIAPVPPSGDSSTYVLLADSMNETDLREPYRQGLLTQFASLLRSILDMIELDGTLDSTGAPVRPRKEIIEEEMDRVREMDRHLMFALVHLNDAEQVAAGGRIAVAAAERALEATLKKASDERVERFGELTFGVFKDEQEADAEKWAHELQNRLNSGRGALKGGVSIGIAVLGDRHETPELLREDATEALREAYETGTCTIIE